MAKKPSVKFFCKHCGNESARWQGKCPACGEWDALVEAPAEAEPRSRGSGLRSKGSPARSSLGPSSAPRALKDFANERLPRMPIPIGEFNRVLGGGAVPGGSVLVGGEPGIGKSTLLLQVLGALAASGKEADQRPLLYLSGEEAPSQIAARGLRLGEHSEGATKGKFAFESERLRLASETDLEGVLALLEAERPRVAVIDSVQTLRDPQVNSAPGSVSQVRECAMALVDAGRRLDVTIFLIGHVTKDGTIAGPRVLEHVVDTVLSFEGEARLGLRCLRALKNRFGSTDEVGLFEMTSYGLEEVADPSRVLLDREGDADKGPGSTVGALCEASRVLLVEVQGLCVPAPGGGTPRRRASGLDANRMAMLLAVLEARAGVSCGTLDVFASAAGGYRIVEPAADLPLVLALASAATGRPIRAGLVSAGEVGLGGEVRPIPRLDARVAEARRLGFNSFLMPARGKINERAGGLKVLRARNLREALAMGLE